MAATHIAQEGRQSAMQDCRYDQRACICRHDHPAAPALVLQRRQCNDKGSGSRTLDLDTAYVEEVCKSILERTAADEVAQFHGQTGCRRDVSPSFKHHCAALGSSSVA